MTQFEYISVAVAIVLSLAVVRLLDAVPHLGTPGRRYWIQSVWVAFLMWWSAVFWWFSWSHSAHRGEFGFGAFVLMIAPPGILYLAATALVGHEPSAVVSWREHFWRVRRRFFAYLLAFLASLVLTSFLMQKVPLRHPLRAMQTVLAAVLVTGLATGSERIHRVLAGFLAAFALVATALAVGGILHLDLRVP